MTVGLIQAVIKLITFSGVLMCGAVLGIAGQSLLSF